jgi:hypothetical protein
MMRRRLVECDRDFPAPPLLRSRQVAVHPVLRDDPLRLWTKIVKDTGFSIDE